MIKCCALPASSAVAGTLEYGRITPRTRVILRQRPRPSAWRRLPESEPAAVLPHGQQGGLRPLPLMSAPKSEGAALSAEGHCRLLTRALMQYVERYGMTDLAREALSQLDPFASGKHAPEGRPGEEG